MKTTLHRPVIHASGLTLLELLVVLSILAVLSTVALTSSSGIADQARYEATQRTLENIREAVLGPANLRDTDGTLLYTGFVADTGRLPRAVAEIVDGGTVLTLAELFEQPAGMAAYQVLPAIRMYCTPSTEADAEDPVPPDEVSEDTVRLGVGWRGPYMRLAPGNFLPQDGWGAQLVTPVGVVPGFPNNCLLNGILPAAEGAPIDRIISYGRDGAPNGVDMYDADLPSESLASQYEAELTVQVQLRDDMNDPFLPESGESVKVRLFSPDPVNGRIRVAVRSIEFDDMDADVSNDPSSEVTFSFTEVSNGSGIPLSIGPRAIKAYFDDDVSMASDDPKSPPAYLMLRPGQNNRTLVIIVP